MTSEILIRRYDKLFSFYDTNGNGYVEEADIKRLQSQFLTIFGESATSARGAEVARLWDGYWPALLAVVDHAADGRISSQQWCDGLARLAGDQASFNTVLTPWAAAVFRLIDTDGDDQVGPAEWRSLQEGLGNGAAADASFAGMDINHNGYLTVDELLDAVREWLVNPDPDARGGWLFGEV